MASRLRKILESIAYAGMQPSARNPEPKQADAEAGVLRRIVNRALSGSANQDPLYLSNRTFGQRLRFWFLIALPVILLAGGVVVAVSVLGPPPPPKPKELTSAELAQKIVPLSPDIQLSTNTDLEVLELRINRGAAERLAGSVRNKSDHLVHAGEIVIDLTSPTGSQLGAVSVRVSELAAGAVYKFDQPIAQKEAAFALVREMRTQ